MKRVQVFSNTASGQRILDFHRAAELVRLVLKEALLEVPSARFSCVETRLQLIAALWDIEWAGMTESERKILEALGGKGTK